MFTGVYLQKQPLEVLYKKGVLNNMRPATLLKKETLAKVFFVNFTKFSRALFFTEHLLTTASVFIYIHSCFIFI